MNKILFFDFNLPYLLSDSDLPVGGATIQAQKWIAGLSAAGQEIGVLVDGFTNYPTNGDIDFVKTFDLKKGIPVLNWIYYRYPKLNQAIKAYQPDYIYHAGAGFTSWVLATIAKRNNIKFIYRVANDADTDERIKQRLPNVTRFFYEQSLKITDVILCQNQYQFKNLKRKFPDKSIAVFHNPYDFGEHLPLIKPLNERKYVAWLGIFQYQKNLSALSEIVKALPSLEFRIAGKPQKNLDNETSNALKNLRKCPNVEFVGFLKRSEVNTFLSSAYLLLNTSHYEGFSNTFLEALAAGTPIVCTQKVDPDEIVTTNNLGFACENYEQIPAAIQKLLKEEKYLAACKRCRKYILKAHDHRVLTRQLLNYLKNQGEGDLF